MSAGQRVAIVTGAAGGIGRALVGGLLGQGLQVAAVDRTAEGLAELAQSALERQQGANLLTIEADLAQDESIDKIVSQARAPGSAPSIFWSTMPVSGRRRSAATTASGRSSSGR